MPTTDAPRVNCWGLPGCLDNKDASSISKPGGYNTKKNIALEFISKVIGQAIKYVAVMAVFAVMFS